MLIERGRGKGGRGKGLEHSDRNIRLKVGRGKRKTASAWVRGVGTDLSKMSTRSPNRGRLPAEAASAVPARRGGANSRKTASAQFFMLYECAPPKSSLGATPGYDSAKLMNRGMLSVTAGGSLCVARGWPTESARPGSIVPSGEDCGASPPPTRRGSPSSPSTLRRAGPGARIGAGAGRTEGGGR